MPLSGPSSDSGSRLASSAQLPYYQDYTEYSSTKLSTLQDNAEVNALRDEYGADIVLLVDYLRDACGIA